MARLALCCFELEIYLKVVDVVYRLFGHRTTLVRNTCFHSGLSHKYERTRVGAYLGSALVCLCFRCDWHDGPVVQSFCNLLKVVCLHRFTLCHHVRRKRCEKSCLSNLPGVHCLYWPQRNAVSIGQCLNTRFCFVTESHWKIIHSPPKHPPIIV